jgi:hypothetical protein
MSSLDTGGIGRICGNGPPITQKTGASTGGYNFVQVRLRKSGRIFAAFKIKMGLRAHG